MDKRLWDKQGTQRTSCKVSEERWLSPILETNILSPLVVWTQVGPLYDLRLDKSWLIIVIWFDAPESIYHVLQGETLPRNPMAENAWTICCKALGLWVVGRITVRFVGCDDGRRVSSVGVDVLVVTWYAWLVWFWGQRWQSIIWWLNDL